MESEQRPGESDMEFEAPETGSEQIETPETEQQTPEAKGRSFIQKTKENLLEVTRSIFSTESIGLSSDPVGRVLTVAGKVFGPYMMYEGAKIAHHGSQFLNQTDLKVGVMTIFGMGLTGLAAGTWASMEGRRERRDYEAKYGKEG